MTVTVERFDAALVPDHGRPMVLELRGPEGRLSVHIERADGSLWLFAHGARGGDLGHAVIGLSRAAALDDWLHGDMDRVAPCTTGVLYFEEFAARGVRHRRVVVARRPGLTRQLRLRVDTDGAEEELVACLRGWVAAVAKHEGGAV